jgi:hypothetical protein
MSKRVGNSGTRWSINEDIQLCESWRFVSHDPAKGKDQSKDELWASVHRHYVQNWSGNPEDVRSAQGMTNRWKTMKRELLLWHSSVRKARQFYKSGFNLMDEVIYFVYSINVKYLSISIKFN